MKSIAILLLAICSIARFASFAHGQAPETERSPFDTTSVAPSPEPQEDAGPFAANEVRAGFSLEVKPRIMACLCKSYGYEQFTELWVARAVFKNADQSQATDYRVRFRVPDYTDEWSAWNRRAAVGPGQTVTDAYFPLFNVEKTARIDGTRRAVVEVEYEYTAGGKTIRGGDMHPLEILGRNEVIVDDPVMLPYVLASFASKDDPIIQRQFAGMVSSQIPGGIPASQRLTLPANADEQTRKNFDPNLPAKIFMRELYRFMLHNKIVYQTPPIVDGVQHIKFGRDVVLNHAGTCVDLSIFYASVCEAVGLEPVFFLPEGHCLPAVCLPPREKGQEPEIVPIETTMLQPGTPFETANTAACKKVDGEPHRTVVLMQLRRRGVHSLELPSIEDDALEKAGITPALPNFGLAGTWKHAFVVKEALYTAIIRFRSDGTCTGQIADGQGTVLFECVGRYSCWDGHYVFRGSFIEEATVTWIDRDHFKYKAEKSTSPGAAIGIEAVYSRAD